MKWLLLGVFLGLLLVFPPLLTAVAATVAFLIGQPLVIAFVLGLLARPLFSRKARRWAA